MGVVIKVKQVILILFVGVLCSSCAFLGGPRTNIKCENSRSVPLPNKSSQSLQLKDVTRAYSLPYAQLFMVSLKVLKSIDYELQTFNSSSGIIEFNTNQGESLYLRVFQNRKDSNHSMVQVLRPDGSNINDKRSISMLFNAIDGEVKKSN